ncbi:N-acetyltransferase NAT13 [Pyrrhoderma noxium]|uniref:N-acetyltransferase NAT13 n=1 Tax=Pyrrhoderma noxium TaxID=2282107 RepID=A0A286UH92_9AGAM|nr:N-acetyltransferase NAT13 [Pyrrhoderma noxium]
MCSHEKVVSDTVRETIFIRTMTSTSSKKNASRPDERISFSSITTNNLGTVRVLNSTLFPIKYSEKFYKDILSPDVEDFCKLVYLNDVPIGTICCRIETKDDENNLYLMTMGVLAPYRSRNIGSRTIQHILDAAKVHKKPKISNVYLHVQVSNADAKRFYERHDFKEIGIAQEYYKKIEPRDAWILEHKVTEPESNETELQDISPETAA